MKLFRSLLIAVVYVWGAMSIWHATAMRVGEVLGFLAFGFLLFMGAWASEDCRGALAAQEEEPEKWWKPEDMRDDADE